MHTDWNFLKKILLFERKWIKWYLIMKPVGEGWWRDCGRPGPAPALATCRHLLVVTWPGEWQAVFRRDQWPGSPVASIQTNGGGRNQSWHVSTGKRQQRGVCDQPRPASTAATVQLTSMVCGILQSDELCWQYLIKISRNKTENISLDDDRKCQPSRLKDGVVFVIDPGFS